MPPIDPLQLLKGLTPLLTTNGGIKGPTESRRICGLMKEASKLVSRCVYINILKATESQEVLEKFIEDGGWDILNQWLTDFKEIDNPQLLTEIMKLYREMPVTVDILKKNSAAKTIKQLGKSEHEGMKTLSSEIVDKWMKKVREKSSNETTDADKSKKKKSSKDSKDEKKEKDRSKSDSKKSDSKNKTDDSKNSSTKSDKVKEESEDLNVIKGRGVVTPGNGLKLHIKLERSDAEKKDSDSKKKPSTVKRLPGRFRSTGLEEEPDLQKKKPESNSAKRPGSEQKPKEEEPPEKKSRLHLSTSISPVTTTNTVNTSPPITSPGDIHAKLKTVPPAKSKGHEIHESSIFMDMITRGSTERQPGPMRRKKKLPSINGGQTTNLTPVKSTTTTTTTAAPSTPTTPPTPPSPTTLNNQIAKSLPSVPSFYKDTLETSEETPEKEEEKRSPSPTEDIEKKEPEQNGDVPQDVEMKEPPPVDEESNQSEEKIELAPSEDSSSSDLKGLLTTSKKNKKNKSVTWTEESKLRVYHYFEMDETERVNVNRVDFDQLKKQDMLMDRRMMESSKRLISDKMVEQIPWRRPPVIEGLPPGVDKGSLSIEKDIQRERELVVLQALFFNKDMLPDSPAEPDLEPFEPSDPKFIPLEDETTGGDDNVYNHEQPGDPSKPLPQPNLQPPSGLNQASLPPELMNMLASLQHGQQPDLMANIQNVLATVMGSMGGQSQETYDKIRELLLPLQNQGIIPDMNMIMGPPGPMGARPRLGLLGQAPPGFMGGLGPGMPVPPARMPGPPPNMQGPPPRFPPGPEVQGGEGWGDNMMGGPPGGMAGRGGGRGGMPMRGGGRMPMPGPPNQGPPMGPGPPMPPGPGGPQMPGPPQMRGGGGQRGGRMRGPEGRAICRHFAGGGCRRGNTCSFLHPGVNGPP